MAVSTITDEKNTAPKIVDFQRCMAPMGGLEPLTYRLGGDRYYPTELHGQVRNMGF